VSEREFTRLVDQLVIPSFLPSLGCKLLFVFPLTNAQLALMKRKMLSNGSANVKHSEGMSDEMSQQHVVRAFLQLFCRMQNRSYVSDGEFTHLVGRSVGQSFFPWVINFCLYFS